MNQVQCTEWIEVEKATVASMGGAEARCKWHIGTRGWTVKVVLWSCIVCSNGSKLRLNGQQSQYARKERSRTLARKEQSRPL